MSTQKRRRGSAESSNPEESHDAGSTSTEIKFRRILPEYSNGPQEDRFSELSSLVHNCSHLELVHLTSEIKPLLRRDFIQQLPYELARRILSFLGPKELFQCAQVSATKAPV